jgi:hypothetical protein
MLQNVEYYDLEDIDRSLRISIVADDDDTIVSALEKLTDMVKFGMKFGKGSRAKHGFSYHFSIRNVKKGVYK